MFSKKNRYIFFVLYIIVSSNLPGQDADEAIPGGFHDFLFDDSLEIVKGKLRSDNSFSYRGDPDVSMMLTPDKSIIDTAGSGFIERAYFIFFEEKLYQITLIINRDIMDFYTFQTRFTSKYGNPDSLDPTGMIWEDNKNRISLEYPLTVKFVNMDVFTAIIAESELGKSHEEILRKDFLESF